MKGRKKQNRNVRTRDWTDKHEFAFTHDRARHRKAEAAPPTLAPEIDMASAGVRPNAIVVSHTGRWAFVKMEGQDLLCLIDERLGDARTSVLASGDDVYVELQEGSQPVIRGVAPRRTKLSRLAHVHSSLSEQVVAANVDVLLVVASARQPAFKPGLVDRYMIAAEVGGVKPLLVVNKMDLVSEEPSEIAQYRELGLAVLNVSCVDGTGIDALRDALRGTLSVVAGHSGVGKSSLITALDPAVSIATQEVSISTNKGRHTTTAARLYTLQGGIRIIDTPGARTLGLWGVTPEELAYYFPEMEALASGCRFRNCTHIHEPHCAVLEAVADETIPKARYASYRRIRESLE